MKSVLVLVALAVTALQAVCADAAVPTLQSVPEPATRSALPAKRLPNDELLSALRKGGYVLYFRHTSTDFSRDDARSQNDDDCDNQRPLTDKGREEARTIGAAIKALKIPIETVLASPRCRTVETALLAFGRADKAAAARGGPADPKSKERYMGLRQLLVTPFKPGGNLAIASHGNPFFAVAGRPYLAEGECAVIRPLGNDFEVIARIRVEDWAELRRAVRSSSAS
jgi:broad specificity phosphatase PhoE